jgi:hypothetical protein
VRLVGAGFGAAASQPWRGGADPLGTPLVDVEHNVPVGYLFDGPKAVGLAAHQIKLDRR